MKNYYKRKIIDSSSDDETIPIDQKVTIERKKKKSNEMNENSIGNINFLNDQDDFFKIPIPRKNSSLTIGKAEIKKLNPVENKLISNIPPLKKKANDELTPIKALNVSSSIGNVNNSIPFKKENSIVSSMVNQSSAKIVDSLLVVSSNHDDKKAISKKVVNNSKIIEKGSSSTDSSLNLSSDKKINHSITGKQTGKQTGRNASSNAGGNLPSKVLKVGNLPSKVAAQSTPLKVGNNSLSKTPSKIITPDKENIVNSLKLTDQMVSSTGNNKVENQSITKKSTQKTQSTIKKEDVSNQVIVASSSGGSDKLIASSSGSVDKPASNRKNGIATSSSSNSTNSNTSSNGPVEMSSYLDCIKKKQVPSKIEKDELANWCVAFEISIADNLRSSPLKKELSWTCDHLKPFLESSHSQFEDFRKKLRERAKLKANTKKCEECKLFRTQTNSDHCTSCSCLLSHGHIIGESLVISFNEKGSWTFAHTGGKSTEIFQFEKWKNDPFTSISDSFIKSSDESLEDYQEASEEETQEALLNMGLISGKLATENDKDDEGDFSTTLTESDHVEYVTLINSNIDFSDWANFGRIRAKDDGHSRSNHLIGIRKSLAKNIPILDQLLKQRTEENDLKSKVSFPNNGTELGKFTDLSNIAKDLGFKVIKDFSPSDSVEYLMRYSFNNQSIPDMIQTGIALNFQDRMKGYDRSKKTVRPAVKALRAADKTECIIIGKHATLSERLSHEAQNIVTILENEKWCDKILNVQLNSNFNRLSSIEELFFGGYFFNSTTDVRLNRQYIRIRPLCLPPIDSFYRMEINSRLGFCVYNDQDEKLVEVPFFLVVPKEIFFKLFPKAPAIIGKIFDEYGETLFFYHILPLMMNGSERAQRKGFPLSLSFKHFTMRVHHNFGNFVGLDIINKNVVCEKFQIPFDIAFPNEAYNYALKRIELAKFMMQLPFYFNDKVWDHLHKHWLASMKR